MPTEPTAPPERLKTNPHLHRVHWAVVALSGVLTIGAWQIARSQVRERIERQFDREAKQVTELIQERMQKYEDALWSGVAMLSAQRGDCTYDEWLAFSESLRIDSKYPGINGIGIIHEVQRDGVEAYLDEERAERPSFEIHPSHQRSVLFPITYIEPLATNAAAVGLDIAHEQNRYQAALQARATGTAQITGPIVLVQDEDRTPGFLFYAPFEVDPASGLEPGMVYAPFVMQRLMQGVLSKELRHVNVRVSDGESALYDELTEDEADFDPDPQFRHSATLAMYGRDWTFDIWSGRSFRTAQSSAQPIIILIGGIVIDTLIILVFYVLSRSNRRAVAYADAVTAELRERNDELEQFVYTASHDLKTPLLTLEGYAGYLREDVARGRLDRLSEFSQHITSGVTRMRTNIDDLLAYSRIGRVASAPERVDLDALVANVVDELIASADPDAPRPEFDIAPNLPVVHGDPRRLHQIVENLLTNAVLHGRPLHGTQRVSLTASRAGRETHLVVSDNGPGIDETYRERVFGLFQRLDAGTTGSGVGLAIVRRSAELHGGRVWVEKSECGGAAFHVVLTDEAAVETSAESLATAA